MYKYYKVETYLDNNLYYRMNISDGSISILKKCIWIPSSITNLETLKSVAGSIYKGVLSEISIYDLKDKV